MGKIVKVVAVIAAVALAIPTGGGSLLAVGLGVSALAATGIVLGLTVAGALLTKPKAPQIPNAQRDRLFSTIDPGTPRKIAYGGPTALGNDIRYEEWSGTNQDYLDRIICVASHEVTSIDEIWIEDRQAWTSGGGVTSTFSGYLTVATRLVGTSANTISINGGATWGSTCRLTGCAYIHLQFKTTGNSKTAESPFASSIPQRVTIVGDGAKLYDPRLDTTAGGSGSHRSNDQTTWAWVSTAVGNNPALQILHYLLGYKIGGKLAVGRGIPPARIDMASFIAAANLCEESVALSGGGTEQRYKSAGVISESDAPSSVLDVMLASCAGTLRDSNGQLSLSILHNDLASPVAAFTDDDVLGAFNWQGERGLDESFNQIRGKRTDPSANSLYQLVDYPAVTLTSEDGLERIHTFDLAMVQSASQAQRLAKQELQRAQYQGVFSADYKMTALKASVGDVVTQTFSSRGWSAKLFRITSQTIRMNGVISLEMREENSAIYAWSAEETAAVTPAAPSVYDPLNSPLIQGISAAALTIRYPEAFPTDPPIGSLYFDATAKQFRFEGTPLLSGGVAITSEGVAVTDSGWADVQDTAIPAAALTADWDSVTGATKPSDNADVTALNSPSMTVPPSFSVTADYLGVIDAAQLPATLVCSRKLGDTNVDSSTSWSATFPAAVNGAIDTESADENRGNVSVYDVTGSGYLGDIVVTSTYANVSLSSKIAVTKTNAAAPSAGGSGATSASISSWTAVSSSSYGSANGGPVTVAAPVSGNVTVSGSLSFKVPKSTGAGLYGLSLKAQWRVVAGSWADITTEVSATVENQIVDVDGFLENNAGTITFSFQKTGLTSGTDYEFQILARRSGSNPSTGTRTITGTANVTQG